MKKMDKFISVRISELDADRRFINISHIVSVMPSEKGCIIYTDEQFDREYHVIETYDFVIRTIRGLLRYK